KAGAAFLPLDPSLPAARLDFMLRDSGAALLLTRRDLLRTLPEGPWGTLCLDDDLEEADSQDDVALETVCPDDLCYVIYTSGTTGTPKGVGVEHRSLANLVAHQAKAYAVGPSSRVLMFASPGFDASLAEVFRALTSGACLVLAHPERLLPGE